MGYLYVRTQASFIKIVDLILPPRCPVTGDIVDFQGLIASHAWRGLDFITDPLCARCGLPLDFEIGQGGQCMDCLDQPPAFDSARAALKYNDVSRHLILGFKHGDKTHVVKSFTPWLEQVGREMLTKADYLVPVPLHPFRLISRRYNQSALIAQNLSEFLDIVHLPTMMLRVRATPSQGHLNGDERAKNVRKAFAINPKYKEMIRGKSLVLIDDVYTTGATIQECSRVLRQCGAGQVHALTLARVV